MVLKERRSGKGEEVSLGQRKRKSPKPEDREISLLTNSKDPQTSSNSKDT